MNRHLGKGEKGLSNAFIFIIQAWQQIRPNNLNRHLGKGFIQCIYFYCPGSGVNRIKTSDHTGALHISIISIQQEKAKQLATYCLLLALLSCFHSSGKNKSEQRLSKLQNTAESESAESES